MMYYDERDYNELPKEKYAELVKQHITNTGTSNTDGVTVACWNGVDWDWHKYDYRPENYAY